MGKKDYKTGLAGLLTPTVEEDRGTGGGKGTLGTFGTNEATESLYVTPISSALKRRMDVYCAEHRVKKHEFVSEAIRKYLDMEIL